MTNHALPLDDDRARGGPPHPCLIVLGGLPGVGKTTVCREVRTRDYEPWPEAGLRLDTGCLLPAGAASHIDRALPTLLGAGP